VGPVTRAHRRLVVAGLAVGVADGLVFLAFEWVAKDGTHWVWNDLADSDAARWRVVPLAIALSLGLSAVLRWTRQPRWIPPHLDPLASAEDGPPAARPTLAVLGATLAAGAASMVAGASLGPEAPLMGFAAGLGAWVAAGEALVLAAVGALLVAFFGSLIPVLIPLLLLARRDRRPAAVDVTTIVVAGLAAWATLRVVHGNHDGFGGIARANVEAHDYPIALVLGVVAAGIGALLRWFVARLAGVAERVADGARWWVAAVVFGAVLGALYLVGGESVQFSGAEGAGLLAGHEPPYGAWALAGIVVVKLLATSWSASTGYRGGLVFPSVYAGVAVSLLVADVVPGLAGPGVLLGSVAGLLVEMTAPVLGAILLLALLPGPLLPLGLAGAAGAIAGRALLGRVAQGADAQ
jgi:H+/Cl- antiporter ClcA